MKQSFGQKLSSLRKENNYTQDEIAVRLGVTPQAVSKWENDLSCPDIMILPELAKIYQVRVDFLLSSKKSEDTCADTPFREAPHVQEKGAEKANYDNLFLKVLVDSKCGDNVKVKVPMPIVRVLLDMGLKIPELSGLAGLDLKQIDLDQIFLLVESGIIGEIVCVQTQNGDYVRVLVEE